MDNSKLREIAKNSYKNHVIRKDKSREGHWRLQCPYKNGVAWKNDMAVDIVCLFNRAIYVGGDVEPVTFAYGPTEPLSRVAWVAGMEGDRYLAEKAVIGSFRDAVWKSCSDTLRESLRELLVGDYLDEEDRLLVRECLQLDYGQERVCDTLHSELLESLSFEVIRPHIFYAQAACARAYELLCAEELK